MADQDSSKTGLPLHVSGTIFHNIVMKNAAGLAVAPACTVCLAGPSLVAENSAFRTLIAPPAEGICRAPSGGDPAELARRMAMY